MDRGSLEKIKRMGDLKDKNKVRYFLKAKEILDSTCKRDLRVICL